MTNDDFIRALVADLRPVRRLGTPGKRTRLWVVLAMGCVFAGVSLLGVRTDLSAKLHEPFYLREGAALLATFVLCAWSAFRLSVPGAEEDRAIKSLPLLGVSTWLVFAALRQPLESSLPPSTGLSCVWRMIGLAFAPALALFWMLRRGGPLARGWSGLFAVLAASSLAIVGTQALCARDDAQHVLLWHGLPLILSGLIGSALGRTLIGR